VKEETFGKGAPCGNPSVISSLQLTGEESWFKERRNLQAPNGNAWGNRKKQLLPNRVVEDRKLEAPTAANCAPVLMPAQRAAVAQKDRCHLVGQLRVPKAR